MLRKLRVDSRRKLNLEIPIDISILDSKEENGRFLRNVGQLFTRRHGGPSQNFGLLQEGLKTSHIASFLVIPDLTLRHQIFLWFYNQLHPGCDGGDLRRNSERMRLSYPCNRRQKSDSNVSQTDRAVA